VSANCQRILTVVICCLECAYRTEDQQVKLTFISFEKSLVDVVTAVQQFDGVLPTVEIIKLAEVRHASPSALFYRTLMAAVQYLLDVLIACIILI